MPPKPKNYVVPKALQAKRYKSAVKILLREDAERQDRGVKARNTGRIRMMLDEGTPRQHPVTDQRFRKMFKSDQAIWDAKRHDKAVKRKAKKL